MTKNGICKVKNEDESRVHVMTRKVDGLGNVYESCEKCGTMVTGITEEDMGPDPDDE
jgi:hypothetical protein